MSSSSNWSMCQIICGLIAVAAGLIVIWLATGPMSFIAALLMGAALALFLGLVLTRLFCTPDQAGAASGAPVASNEPAVASASIAESTAAADKAAADKAAAKEDAATVPDYDKDGVREGSDEGTRPASLTSPRGSKADNLKEIKGVGPKLEAVCNELGFYHFDQIAAWGPQEVAWVDANLKGFRGRVSRDAWVDQAKVLAAGGETEFSKRVEDGDVY